MKRDQRGEKDEKIKKVWHEKKHNMKTRNCSMKIVRHGKKEVWQRNRAPWKESITNKMQHEGSENINKHTQKSGAWKKYHECEWNKEKLLRIVHYSAGSDNEPCNDKLLCTSE